MEIPDGDTRLGVHARLLNLVVTPRSPVHARYSMIGDAVVPVVIIQSRRRFANVLAPSPSRGLFGEVHKSEKLCRARYLFSTLPHFTVVLALAG